MNYELLLNKFMQMAEEEDSKNNPWKAKLIRDAKGKVKNCIENYILYFIESEKYKGKLKYNEFLAQKEFDGKEWNDFDEDKACYNIEHDIDLGSAEKTRRALNCIFDDNKYNPIQDYFKGLKWDGEKRIETVFIKLLEADDTVLNRAMSKKWFMAGVKRIMIPGCKFDNILIFQGNQGIGKSTICERLSKGFSNIILLSEINNKDVIDKLNKTWIGIIDEMDAFNKKDMTTIKTFLSTSSDSTRLAYARNTCSYKRHCIFIGSTNDETFLRDNTSSTERRFWILRCHREKYSPIVNEVLTEEYVDQLWAEAYYELYKDINQYLDIEAELSDDFAATQKEFKTYNNDQAIDYVKEILDKEYVFSRANKLFQDNNDFLRQYRGEILLSGPKSYINKIPMSSLMYVLKSVYKEERGAKYIALALKDEWEYKKINYGGKSTMGLYRKDPKNEIIEDFDEKLPI